MNKCDFCSTIDPTWLHPSEDFVLEDDGWGSADGAWAACEECHALIEAGLRDGLSRRSVDTYVARHPEVPWTRDARRALMARIKKMHAGFWKGRNGEPRRQTSSLIQEGQHKGLDL